jgi:hypothetical protein
MRHCCGSSLHCSVLRFPPQAPDRCVRREEELRSGFLTSDSGYVLGIRHVRCRRPAGDTCGGVAILCHT